MSLIKTKTIIFFVSHLIPGKGPKGGQMFETLDLYRWTYIDQNWHDNLAEGHVLRTLLHSKTQ